MFFRCIDYERNLKIINLELNLATFNGIDLQLFGN